MILSSRLQDLAGAPSQVLEAQAPHSQTARDQDLQGTQKLPEGTQQVQLFPQSLLPYPLLCITRLIIALRIHLKPLRTTTRQPINLFNRHNIQDVDYVPLKRKESMLDKERYTHVLGCVHP